MIQAEEWYQECFPNLVCKGTDEQVTPLLRGSEFYREVSFNYAQNLNKSRGTKQMPAASVDFIEIDRKGYLHLWEAKLLDSYELTSGRVIGQLIFYDWLFRTASGEYIYNVLRGAGIPLEKIKSYSDKDVPLLFQSWNILVCGGYGYEIAAGVNPIMWNHHTISKTYFSQESPAICTYQLYHKQGKDIEELVVRDIWHMSIFNPDLMESNALAAYLESQENWLYDWKIVGDKVKLIPRPDFPYESLGTVNDIPESAYWELTGRKHLAHKVKIW